MKTKLTDLYGNEAMYHVRLEDIREPQRAMRKNIDFDKIVSLANSIREIGLISPIAVRADGELYEIIAGERRYLAMVHLERKTIKAIVAEGEPEMYNAIQIAENIQREDVPVCEEAQALINMKKDHALTQAQLAQLVGKTESYISERLAILSYPPGLFEALAEGKIAFSVARELARIDDPDILKIYTETAMKSGVNPRLAREWVREWKQVSGGGSKLAEDTASVSGDGTADEPQMTTGCHICSQIVPLTKIRRLNVCPDCWDRVFKSLMGQ